MISDVEIKGSWIATINEQSKKINEVSASSVGVFKNAAGQTMSFVKGSWIAIYDVYFKKISERPNR